MWFFVLLVVWQFFVVGICYGVGYTIGYDRGLTTGVETAMRKARDQKDFEERNERTL